MLKIYVTGPIAYETAQKLYRENRAHFEERFPRFFLREFEKLSEEASLAYAFLDKLCIEKNTKTSYSRKKFFYDGCCYACEIADGGIFASLWTACEDLKMIRAEEGKNGDVGCRVRLFDIPVDQHVVEILEYAKENPYEAGSAGCYLVLCSEEAAEGKGLTGIGQITEGKERVILAGENIRYLTPAARQEKDMEERRRANRKDKRKQEAAR